MKQDARIITYGKWGTNRRAFALALTGKKMREEAEKFGLVSGVIEYRNDGKESSEADQTAAGSLPIGLSHSTVFPNTNANKKAGWSSLVGGADYLLQFPSPFGGNVSGLSHVSDEPAAYQGVLIPKDTGHVLRLYIHKPPENIEYPILTANWDGWQFQIAESDTVLQRLAPTWNQPDETTLIELLGIKQPTGPQSEQIEELKRTLYKDTTSIQLGTGSSEYPRFYELEFIPEIGGKCTVYCNGALAGVADHTDILKTRQPGVLWNETPLVIRRNGGHFSWQTGYQWFGATGEMRWPYRINYELEPLENMVFNKVASEPSGTSITIWQDEERSEIVATFTTSNRRVTPFLYLAQAYLDAGVRGGDNHADLLEISFDSDVEVDKFGSPQILEIEPECEGELRRAQFSVEFADVLGKTFKNMGGAFYSTIEHCVVDMEVGGQKQITKGIVKNTTSPNWGSAQANQIRANVARPDTLLRADICDAWSLLEEHELEGGELVGDGLRPGVLLRRAIRRIGTPWEEMEGIPDGSFLSGQPKSAAGAIMPSAALGESSWAVVNEPGTLADFIYYIVERYGFGRILTRGADGIWYFRKRPKTARVLYGHEVHFRSLASGHHHSETYPGRFTMLQPLDISREIAEFFNKFRLRGANGYDDEPLVQEHTIRESLERGFGGGSLKHIGRERRMKTIEDSSLRTRSAVSYSLQSAVEMHGQPPIHLGFQGYYIPGLFVGDPVKADGSDYIIKRLSGGSWANDTMNYLLQRTGY